jgi:hypothetical protein
MSLFISNNAVAIANIDICNDKFSTTKSIKNLLVSNNKKNYFQTFEVAKLRTPLSYTSKIRKFENNFYL